jgi:hypothetical protein
MSATYSFACCVLNNMETWIGHNVRRVFLFSCYEYPLVIISTKTTAELFVTPTTQISSFLPEFLWPLISPDFGVMGTRQSSAGTS